MRFKCFTLLFCISLIFIGIFAIPSSYAYADNAVVTESNANIVLYIGQAEKLEAIIAQIEKKRISSAVKPVWSSSAPNYVTVDQNGTVKGKGVGGAIISVTAIYGSEHFVTSIKVYSKSAVDSIYIDHPFINLDVGQEKTVNVIFKPRSPYLKTVKWTTSDSSIATVSNGNVKGIKAGTAIITAISEDGGHEATATVTVKSTVTGVTISHTQLNLKVGQTQTIETTILPYNAFLKTGKWLIKDPKVATISSTGQVTGVSAGSTIVTIVTTDGGYEATCNIIVTGMVNSVTLSNSEKTLNIKETFKLTAAIQPSFVFEKSITWQSSDSSVASVSNGLVTAQRVGSAIITVTTKDGGFKDSCRITVVRDERYAVKGITAVDKQQKIGLGEDKRLEYRITPDIAEDKKVTFSASDACVKIDSLGNMKGTKAGTCIVTVKTNDGGFEDRWVVIVESMVTGLTLEPNSMDVYVGEEKIIEATVAPRNAVVKTVKWESVDPAIATVDSSGKVKGISKGTVIISAITEDAGVKKSCVVNVKNYLREIKFLQDPLPMAVGEIFKPRIIYDPEDVYQDKVTLKSDNENIISVDKEGRLVAHRIGQAIVTAIALDGGLQTTCKVEVKSNAEGVEIYDEDGNLISTSEKETSSDENEKIEDKQTPSISEKPQGETEKDASSNGKEEQRNIPETISVVVDGVAIAFDQPPIVENNRVLVPMRKIFEALGAQVFWRADLRQVKGKKGNNVVILRIDNAEAFINQESIKMDVPARLINGSTMVPVRFIGESLGVVVNWDAATQTVSITQ